MATYTSYLEYILNSLVSERIKKTYLFNADYTLDNQFIRINIHDLAACDYHSIIYKPKKSDNINSLVLQLFFTLLNTIPSYSRSKARRNSKLGKVLYK